MALTKPQIRRQEKDVTRRNGWHDLKPGTRLQPVEKAQGLKKGERARHVGGPIVVVSVRRERLLLMIASPRYGREECRREGFGHLTPRQFVQFFCDTHGLKPEDNPTITRIEFAYCRRRRTAPQ